MTETQGRVRPPDEDEGGGFRPITHLLALLGFAIAAAGAGRRAEEVRGRDDERAGFDRRLRTRSWRRGERRPAAA
jgi:hypothetical protein